jgi:NTE family protein
VLQVLEREQVPVDFIAGSNAGSVVGLVYTAGFRAEQLAQMACRVHWRRIAGLGWSRVGLISLARLELWLVRTVGDLTFADLAIPYAAVATDLQTWELVVLREGRVAPAVRASCIGRWLGGLSSLLRLSAGDKLMAVGQRVAEEALPTIRGDSERSSCG